MVSHFANLSAYINFSRIMGIFYIHIISQSWTNEACVKLKEVWKNLGSKSWLESGQECKVHISTLQAK